MKVTETKTIKQLADEIGVSKQAVTYRLKQLEATKENGILATKENGILVVSLAGEKLIKSAFFENARQTFGDKIPPKYRQKEMDILAVLQDTITALQRQLSIKDGQLEEKDKQIDHLYSELQKEREHSRELADKIADLAHTAQQLHGMSEGNTALQLMSSDKKRPWWQFWGKDSTGTADEM
ncbi:winged helix-turn-helix transcriptional regulator (plasmid) [Oscillospiraceae bacterium PP1C4]